MATWVANGTPGATSATLPAGTATGDWVICFAYRDAATAPTLPADWTTLHVRDTATSIRVAYREKDASWSAMPTFTNAGRVVSTTVRPASGKVLALGANASQGATNATWTWTTMTLNVTDGTSVVLRGGAGTRPDVVPPTPASHTLIDASGDRPGFITCRLNTTTSAPTATSVTSRAAVYSTAQVEIKDIAAVFATQAAYRFYDQGAEATSVALGALNTSIIGNITLGDGIGGLRVRLQNTTASSGLAADTYTLQYDKNSSGTWVNVTTADATVAAYNDASLTDAGATTNRLGAGTGSFVAGKISETGTATGTALTGNNYTELHFPLTFKKPSFADGDSVTFRVRRNGSTTNMTYAVTPLVTLVAAKTGTAVVSHGWTATATGVAPVVSEPPGEGTAVVSHDWTASAVGSNAPLPTFPIPATGLVGWWDADDPTTFTYSSGAVVSQWNDKSGQGRHFAQATTSLQPVRNGTLNGRTAVTFDGTDDYMDTAAFTLPQPITAFLMMDLTGDGTQGFLSSVGGDYQSYVGNSTVFFYCGTTAAGLGAGSAYSGAHHWRFTADGVSTSVHTDGEQKVIGDTGTAGTTTGFRIAERNLTGGYRLSGKMCEIVIYDRVLTAPEIVEVESYLTAKWLTAGPPPSTGSATVAWSETITAAGKAGPGRGSATASWSETQTAAGKKPTKSTTITAQWTETITGAAGKAGPGRGSAVATWSETITGVAGKKPSKSTSITSDHTWVSTAVGAAPIVGVNQGTAAVAWTETQTAAGKKPTKSIVVTAQWTETITAAGKKPSKSITTTTQWAETITAAGKAGPGRGSATASWSETLTAAGKRPTKSTSITAAHTWVSTASGVAPTVGVKQGTATVSWSEIVTASGAAPSPATGDRFLETVATTRVLEGGTSRYLESVVSVKQGSAVVSWTETQTAAGKKTPKATAPVVHSWTQIAQGVAPVPGVKQGTAIVNHSWSTTAGGKRVPKSSITSAHTWAATAAGKKTMRGSATTASWVETTTAAGKRTPKSVAIVGHTWTLLAQGVRPVVGSSAVVSVLWAAGATGKRTPKSATSPVLVNWISTAAGKKIQRGAATASHLWVPAGVGKRRPVGSLSVVHIWISEVDGLRSPKAQADLDFQFLAETWGISGVVGNVEGQWNGLAFDAVQYGDKVVIDWLLVPS